MANESWIEFSLIPNLYSKSGSYASGFWTLLWVNKSPGDVVKCRSRFSGLEMGHMLPGNADVQTTHWVAWICSPFLQLCLSRSGLWSWLTICGSLPCSAGGRWEGPFSAVPTSLVSSLISISPSPSPSVFHLPYLCMFWLLTPLSSFSPSFFNNQCSPCLWVTAHFGTLAERPSLALGFLEIRVAKTYLQQQGRFKFT